MCAVYTEGQVYSLFLWLNYFHRCLIFMISGVEGVNLEFVSFVLLNDTWPQ